MLLRKLGASLLRNILETSLTSQGSRVNRAGDRALAKSQGWGIVRAGYGNKKFWKTATKDKKNIPLNDQEHFRLNKIKLKIILLQMLKKEN